MKLVKNGNDGLILPNDDVPLLELVIKRSGVQLKSPLPPNDVCKLLSNLSIDLMFSHFQAKEIPRIETPV